MQLLPPLHKKFIPLLFFNFHIFTFFTYSMVEIENCYFQLSIKLLRAIALGAKSLGCVRYGVIIPVME